MLRVAILMDAVFDQLRRWRHCAPYDRGLWHSPPGKTSSTLAKLETVPDILADLAEVEMHAIQTTALHRNITSDHLAASHPMNSRTRVPGARSFANGRVPSRFPICPAIQNTVTGARRPGRSLVHDVGVHIVRGPMGISA